MKKFNIQFGKSDEINTADDRQYPDFQSIITDYRKIKSRKIILARIVTVASLVIIPVILTLGYIQQERILGFFTNPATVEHKKATRRTTVFNVPKKTTEPPLETVKEVKEEFIAKESEIEPGKNMVKSARPRDGFDTLKNYFDTIKILDDGEIVENNYREITVAMWINTAGRPERVKVIEKLSSLVEKQVVDAVENMPSWYPAEIKGDPYRSMISFKIVFNTVEKRD